MRIGIASDTHDNLTKIRDMVSVLNHHGVDFFLHAGDFIAPFAITPFKNLNCDWTGVFGNNDGERCGLKEQSNNKIKEPPFILELNSLKIALMHRLENINADIIICGHTHKPDIRNKDKLIVNPGEVGGWLTGKSSIAVLDLETLKPEILYF